MKKHKLKTFADFYEEELGRRGHRGKEYIDDLTRNWIKWKTVEVAFDDHAKLISHLEARVLELEKENARLEKLYDGREDRYYCNTC